MDIRDTGQIIQSLLTNVVYSDRPPSPRQPPAQRFSSSYKAVRLCQCPFACASVTNMCNNHRIYTYKFGFGLWLSWRPGSPGVLTASGRPGGLSVKYLLIISVHWEHKTLNMYSQMRKWSIISSRTTRIRREINIHIRDSPDKLNTHTGKLWYPTWTCVDTGITPRLVPYAGTGWPSFGSLWHSMKLLISVNRIVISLNILVLTNLEAEPQDESESNCCFPCHNQCSSYEYLWHVVTNTHKFWFRPWLWLWLSIEIIRVERYSQLWLKWMNPVFRVATGMHKRHTITTVKIRWKILTTWKLDYFDSDVRRRVV